MAGVTLTLVTGTITVTTELPVFPPSTVVAVMVTLPEAAAVTSPLGLTAAMAGLLEFQVTFLFVALEGLTVAVNW